jgi:hypothetical protein
MKPSAVDPRRCPLCGAANGCALADGATTCWCFCETISAELLERVPPEAQGVVCICRACVLGLRSGEDLAFDLEG